MAQGLNSTKSAARPSHEAVEDETTATEAGKSAQEKLDHVAMQSAKRAQNRIHANEETNPNDTMFTK
ncbi:hypothetical protein GCM10011507_08740 [Edaphobacter acidisoli]|uniref:Uncharacterized protein n=1 Tax=Edaphobacter acidisoli TaxID=2040573 RepID=A0A916W198_9BACT|nr:hypothetical protein [Edaphobacter acidisoli]GGA59534.1 hypothetical protein GCM10011507_08740 [Edaphobacter acidisoli]